jgi:hypothetical protein
MFAFGCSFTQYMWPTWANIIAYDQKKPLYNFAIAGMGNVGIMQRVLEADLKYNFTEDDDIYIMWSSWSRDDKVINNHYSSLGSIFNKSHSVKWLKENWSMENDIIKNVTAINFVNKVYKDNIVWQGHANEPYTSEIDDHRSMLVKTFTKSESITEIKKLYASALPDIEWKNLEQDKLAFNCFADSHPDVLEHLDIVREWIYPAIDKELKKDTCEKYEEFSNCVYETFTAKKIKDFKDAVPIINGMLLWQFPHLSEYQNIQQIFDNIPDTLG